MRNAVASADAVGHASESSALCGSSHGLLAGAVLALPGGHARPGLHPAPPPPTRRNVSRRRTPVRDRGSGQSSWRWEGRALVQGKELRKVMAKPPGTSVGRRLCVSQRGVARLGSLGRARVPYVPTGPGQGRGPEDPDPPGGGPGENCTV